MASLVLGAVGGLFFGPVGFAIGSMIGSLLFPPTTQGPRLTDLKLTNSSYGAPIPLIYGAMRVTPNVIWQTDLHEHQSGGKGGPSVTTFSYTASFAMQLCGNEIEAVNRIWWNGTLIWNADGSVGDEIPCTVYVGTETQLPDPTIESFEGVGNVNANRGTAYVVFNEYDLTSGGNTIGNWSFEVIQNAPPGDLHIVQRNDAIGFTLGNFPTIQQWNNNLTDPIQISAVRVSASFSVTPSAAEDFDPTTFADVAPSAVTDNFPQWWSGPTPHYGPVGVYFYADGNSTCLWHPDAATQITASDDTPSIITEAATAVNVGSHFEVFDLTRFLYVAGVPINLYLRSTSLSEDGTKLFAFTSTSSSGTNTDHWYRITDGVVDLDGTVSPSIDTIGWGQTAKPGSVDVVTHFENNGQYCWAYNPASSTVNIYLIDGSNNFADWGMGSLSVVLAGGGSTGGVKVITTGLCGLAGGTSIVELSRLAPALGGIPLSDVVSDLSVRAGLLTAQIDVTQLPDLVPGYTVAQQMSCRDAITPLQSAWYFDAVERAGVMTFVKRGGAPAFTIPDTDLAAQAPGGQAPPLLTEIRAQEVDLPAIMNVKYVNAANDYQIGTQMSQRQVTQSQLNSTIELAINIPDAKAKQVANTLLFNAWWERQSYTALTSRQWAFLEPTDVGIIHGQQMRIANKTDVASNIEQFDCVACVTMLWTQGPTAVGTSGFTPATPTPKQQAQLILMDIPLVVDTDHPNGLYAAMAGLTSAAWAGANLYKSVDGGNTYSQIGSTSTPAIIGVVSNALGNFQGGNVFDETNTCTVVVGEGGGDLASATELAVLNGTNYAVIGNELAQYKNAVLTAPSTYLLSGFLRGRRGTEFAIPLHGAGEQFISLPELDVDAPFNELAQVREYKAVSFGMSLVSAPPVSFINYGAKLRPYSPADLGGGVDSSGNVTINWTRRTRIGGAWADYTDATLSEPSEAYVLQIWDAHFQHVARIVNLTSPTFVYTAAMQVADFGSTQLTIFVSVGQVGTYTLGTQASAAVPGGGVSNTSIITPVNPYNNPPPQTGTGCSGIVVATSMSWASPVRMDSGDNAGGPGWTWDISFTTGSIASGAGRIQAFAGSGDQLPMGGTFTLEPCGFPLPPTKVRLPLSSLVSFPFYMTGNPNPGNVATLLPSTTYHLCISRPSVGAAMFVDLFSIL